MDDVAYEFTIEQIEQLEAVTAQLWDMSLKTVEHVLRQGNLADFGLPASALDYLGGGIPSNRRCTDVSMAWTASGNRSCSSSMPIPQRV